MSDSDLRCTVVIPVRNGAGLIGIQLEALTRQTVHDCEVIVSDNGSMDDTREAALAWRDRLPYLRVVDASQQAGVSHARNVGARAATTDKILFCDADDVVDPGWVEAMASALDIYDLAGGRLDTSLLNRLEVRQWTEEPPQDALPTALRYLPYAVGANMGVRRHAMERLDGFDTSFLGGHEEVDFAWRLQRAGMVAGFVPGALVHYRLRTTIRDVARQRFAYGRSSALLQSRYRRQPGLPPFTVRRQVRILGSHLLEAPELLRPSTQGQWIVGFAWCWGRLLGTLRYR